MTTTVKRRLRNGFIALLVVFGLMQFVQTNHNNGTAESPNDVAHAVAVPPPVMQTLRTSCYDCHSNHTDYPWYARVQPTGWWLASHINDGKKRLNFSEFNTYDTKRKNKKLNEIAEEVSEGEMPLKSYLLIHGNARLTDAQANELVHWARSTKAL